VCQLCTRRSFAPAALPRPRNEQDIATAAVQASRNGHRVKVIGALHSFTDLAGTDGIVISLDRMRSLVTADLEQRTVTVQAGIRLPTLAAHLDRLGVALENICDVWTPTIGGAIATATEAIRAVSALIAGSGHLGELGVFVRFVAADALPLSPAYGRESVYPTLSVRSGMPFEALYRQAEVIVRDYGARPLWAKPHTLTATEVAPLYPEWSRFAAIRASVDPEGRFRNAYLDRVLGVYRKH
jgi:FAD/FMN-containing dehydrogenase